MKKSFLISSYLLLTVICFSQSNYCIPNRFGYMPYFDTSDIATQLNVVYGNAFNDYKNVSEDLKMDIYYPKADSDQLSKRPLILYVHGGGFLEGDKSGGAYQCREYAKRGYVAASINYRMGWACAATWVAALCACTDGSGMRAAVYEAVQDHRAALRFLAANASTYGIDTSAFFITGESAGSITTMLSAYINQAEADSFAKADLHGTLGALDSSGNNLYASYRVRGIINHCGGINDTTIMQDSEVLPTISFHDENDCIVPYKKNYVLNCTGNCYNFFSMHGSQFVHEKTLELGACSKLYEVKGSNSHCGFPQDQLVMKSSCFVRGLLCNDCESGYSTNAYDTVECFQSFITGVPKSDGVSEFETLQLYPNPTSGEDFMLAFEAKRSQSLSISFTDILGRDLRQQNIYVERGRNTLNISVAGLPAGVNYCVVRTETGTRSLILVRQ